MSDYSRATPTAKGGFLPFLGQPATATPIDFKVIMEDCGTGIYLYFPLREGDEANFRREGRWWKPDGQPERPLSTQDVIDNAGKTIAMRSALYCKADGVGKFCARCAGMPMSETDPT